MNQQQMTTDQFRDAAKMVPTDCCNSAPEKRLADGIRYWDCAKCGATVWIENPIKDHTEQHLDMVSYTPRTDAETYVWQNGEENPFVQKEFARQLERELAASQAEVAKLNHQLLKTESDLLQSQDINSFLDTEFRIACKRAERAEAEVERLDHLLAGASETNHKLGVEVLVLKKELAAWDYGTRAKREQERAEKAEAEAIQLKAQLNQALAIATEAHEEIGRFFRGDDYTRIGMEIYELKLTIK